MTNVQLSTSRSRLFLIAALICLVIGTSAVAQTTSFTYQGRISDGGTAANGVYDMQFKLYDAQSAGNQIGSTIANNAVTLSNGVFTVQLDFGSASFSGADRFLELGVRSAGSGDPYTVLSPRQQLTSAVYAIRAQSSATADTATTSNTAATATNATQLGGVAAGQYVLTTDPRLSATGNYIQNTTSQQSASNFNISGDGKAAGTLSANAVNATTQYNIDGNRVLSIEGSENTFVGSGAGLSPTGFKNSFFGDSAGKANSDSIGNSFFGASAGKANVDGNNNSFFGSQAGEKNVTGHENSFFGVGTGAENLANLNSFFGAAAGGSTTLGGSNTFMGVNSGFQNTTGFSNTFIGTVSGAGSTTGFGNTFIGTGTGPGNTTGSQNTLVGTDAEVGSPGLTNATAIGSSAKVSQSNALVLGSIAGVNNATASTNVGIGTTSPNATLHLRANNGDLLMGNAGCSSGYVGIGFSFTFNGCHNYSLAGNGTDTILNRPTGGTISFRENNSNQMTIAAGGDITMNGNLTTNGNVGLGTATPQSKLHVKGGDIFINFPHSLILQSFDGKCWKLFPTSSGSLDLVSVGCP